MKKDIIQTHVEEAPGDQPGNHHRGGVFGWMALGVVMMGLGIW